MLGPYIKFQEGDALHFNGHWKPYLPKEIVNTLHEAENNINFFIRTGRIALAQQLYVEANKLLNNYNNDEGKSNTNIVHYYTKALSHVCQKTNNNLILLLCH